MAASTLRYELNREAYIDCGALPLQVQVAGGRAALVLSDAEPAVGDAAFMVMSGDSPITSFASSTQHLWALALSGGPVVTTNPTT